MNLETHYMHRLTHAESGLTFDFHLQHGRKGRLMGVDWTKQPVESMTERTYLFYRCDCGWTTGLYEPSQNIPEEICNQMRQHVMDVHSR